VLLGFLLDFAIFDFKIPGFSNDEWGVLREFIFYLGRWT